MESNRRSWDRRLPVHRDSAFYDVSGFRDGRGSLRSIELAELAGVSGRSLLHLQCHFGLDTLSWARLGARVTGVDFSEPALKLARSLAKEAGLEASFVQSNVYDLTRVLHQQFDVVFTSYGVLCWLPDLRRWARVVNRFLRPGGTFLIVENHPMCECYEEVEGRLELVYPLFQREPFEDPGTRTYADPTATVRLGRNFQWAWTVGGLVEALIGVGLRIESLREMPLGTWQRFASMTRDPDGWWRLPDDPLPLLVSCRAVKPL
jgi:SAM-dependent methyltransferase